MEKLYLKIFLVVALLSSAANASVASNLSACPSDLTVRWHDCFGTFTYPNGDEYVGEWKNDKTNGQGTYTYINGNVYAGDHKENKRTGQGIFIYGPGSSSSGDLYVGQFKDSFYHGQGTYTYTTGKIEKGIWIKDVFQYSKIPTKTVTVAKTPTSLLCPENIYQCDKAYVCKRAVISLNSGKKTWVTSKTSILYAYVVEAKKRGLACGVGSSSSTTGSIYDCDTTFCLPTGNVKNPKRATNTTQLCSKDLTICDNKVLCKRATVAAGSKRQWEERSSFGKYVIEAKKRGLSCGVKPTATIVPKISHGNCSYYTNVNQCNNAALCRHSAHFAGPKRSWRTDQIASYHVVEAKRRGLSCGVAPSSPTIKISPVCSLQNLNVCSDALVCSRGSRLVNGVRIWDGRPNWIKYSAEAKKRGLSCDVEVISPTFDVPTIPPNSVPKMVNNKPKPATLVQDSALLDNPLHIKQYGKAWHVQSLPKIIFFIGRIEDPDEQSFRKALRSHEIDTVVLISSGGSISNGMALTKIIFDNNLTTFIPAGKACMSACAFMFFAGKSKVAQGVLGMQRFWLTGDEKKIVVDDVERLAQQDVADIIEKLAGFGTPSIAFSKMFAKSEANFFSEEEKSTLSDLNKISPKVVTKINKTLSYLIKHIGD